MRKDVLVSKLAQVMVRLFPSPAVRCRMRCNSFVRLVLRLLFGGERSIAYPKSAYRLFYDGNRDMGILANGIEHYEAEEKHLIAKVLKTLRPAVVWDIGANIGTWSMFLTTLLPQSEIRCFEPDPVNLKYLTYNKTRNNLGHWMIRPVALSDQKGKMPFTADLTTGTTGSLEREEPWSKKYFNAPTCELLVEVTTADEEIRGGAAVPQFIKCDVEGHELAVFSGAMELLRTHHPVILFEDSSKTDVASLLHSLGYEFYDMQGHLVETPVCNTLAVHVAQRGLML